MPDKTIIFLHIPKTAGTTLKHVIQRQFPPEARYTDEFSRESALSAFKALPETRRRQIKMLWGHLPYGLHAYLPQPATYFTFLRHPVDRVLSHYYFQRSRPDLFWLPPEIEREKLSLHEVIEQGLIADITNMQTRKLAGLPHLFPRHAYTKEHLETAKRNLRDAFAVIGLQERFDASLMLLRAVFGWRRLYYLPYNVTQRPRRADVPPETIALIEREEAMDMALYHYGKRLFEAQIARQPAGFSAAVNRFRFLNRYLAGPMLHVERRLQSQHAYRVARHGLAQAQARFLGRQVDGR